MDIIELLDKVPQQPQRQDALANQLGDLFHFAQRLGMYDAADYLQQFRNKTLEATRIVYCMKHLRPHFVEVCKTGAEHQIPLRARTIEDAILEVQKMGLRIEKEI